MASHKIVSADDWLTARKDLLAKEKAFTRQRDALSAARRALPWVKLEKDHVFEGPDGRESLADLFAGNSQLIVYHFMLGPSWGEGCKSCSYLADHFDGMLAHLNARDVSFVVVSRAPLPEIQAFQKRMNWGFKWVSSHDSDFNRDFHVSFTPEELEKEKAFYNFSEGGFPSEEAPGASVFYKDAKDQIFHTYSCYSRGLDILIGTYNFLDLVPKGRDEDDLEWTMQWICHHDRYDGASRPERHSAAQ
ncbi:MAG: thioredoxin family protein [Kiloniellaceae bacterium]